jgi:putative transposase
VTETNVFQLCQLGSFADPLTEVLRNGAQALLAQAVEAEIAAFLSMYAENMTQDGRQRLVRHGHLPEREIITGIGPVAVRCPRVRDRVDEGSERIRFSSAILPPYARRSKSLEVLIPILYLKGVSTGDFEEALVALLGKDAGLSASTVGRLKVGWSEEHARWSKRDLSAKRYVYFWADGIHVQARLEDVAQCLLVIIGATPEGKKELVGLIDGVRESAQSWKELLLDLKRRGLTIGPELTVADGALGFWQAIEEVWPKTRGQRCWVHKTANVLNKLPKSQQSKAKRALQEIWMAETKKDALVAFDAFVETWGIKYDKAAECLIKDRDVLLAFYDFPAEHWKHLRTTNVIESSFATVRHRTVRSKGCLSNKTALAMIFKLTEAAERSWRRLDGHNQLPKIILGVRFTDAMSESRTIKAQDSIALGKKINEAADGEVLNHCSIAVEQNHARSTRVSPFSVVDTDPVAIDKFPTGGFLRSAITRTQGSR